MNSVCLAGNLGADPQFRMTNNGQAVMNLRLATQEWSKDEGKRAEWHNVVVWGKQAEGLNKVLKKGSFLLVIGRLQTREWTDRDGNKKYTTEIVAMNTELGPRAAGSADRPAQPRPAPQRAPEGNDWVSQPGFEPPGAPGPGYDAPPNDPFAQYKGGQ